MMPLTELVAQMETDGRQPRILIDAHKETLAVLEALARRIAALEKPHKSGNKGAQSASGC